MVMGFDKLELGGGGQPTEGYLQVAWSKTSNPHILGDVKALFSPDAKVEDFPGLEQLSFTGGFLFNEIRASHFIEHIPWLYQESMFSWLYNILEPGGRLSLETPDLLWVAKSYIKNQRRRKFPIDEQPLLSGPDDFIPWVNYKLFSGCSYSLEEGGDYHHCLYDKDWLTLILTKAGFKASVSSRRGKLRAMAYRPKEEMSSNEYYQPE